MMLVVIDVFDVGGFAPVLELFDLSRSGQLVNTGHRLSHRIYWLEVEAPSVGDESTRFPDLTKGGPLVKLTCAM